MDFVYIAGPALASFLFAFLAANTNPKENPVIRNMFFFASILALVVMLGQAQKVALAGELAPDTDISVFAYNETGSLMNITTTTLNLTRNSPLVVADFDSTWILTGVVIQLVFYLSLILLLWNMLSWLAGAVLSGRQSRESEE
jgi:hypothetical protein